MVKAAINCTKQADCLSVGINSNCIFFSAETADSPPQGICSEPISTLPFTSTTSDVSPTANPSSGPSCGNATITFQCAIGQLCDNEACINTGGAAKTFFTPTIIAIFAVAGVLLFCVPLFLCCFASRKASRSAKKIIDPPLGQQYESYPVQQQPLSSISCGPCVSSIPNPKSASIVSIQRNQSKGPAPLSTHGLRSEPLFHTAEKYMPALPQVNIIENQDILEYIPYEQYERQFRTPGSHQYLESYHARQEQDFKHQNPNLDFRESMNNRTSSYFYPDQEKMGYQTSSTIHPIEESLITLQNPIITQSAHLEVDKRKLIFPTNTGFWAFWDKKGKFHQGYTDSSGNIYGGVFDDLCYFHFGTVGEHEPVLVHDSMMAGFRPQDPELTFNIEDLQDTTNMESKRIFKGENDIEASNQKHNSGFLSNPINGLRERGESMDVLAMSHIE